jgi:gliding motility-associated-like protein
MKKLYSQMSWWLFFASISMLFALRTAQAAPLRPADAISFSIPDTTRVACEFADTAFSTWYNSTYLFLQLTAFPGSSINVTPLPPPGYTFPGTCADTLRYSFDITGTVDTTLLYVFIVTDTQAPRIRSTLADSLNLGCRDSVPNRFSVSITDNCVLDTVIYNETVTGSGNCPYAYKITRTWLARDGCGNTASYRQVIVVSDEDAPIFQQFPRDTVIECSQPTDPGNTGRPVATDGCDPNIRISYFDQIFTTGVACTKDYTIQRTWVAEDTCGNANFRPQKIIVRDTKAPVFTAPRDTTVGCELGDDPSVTGRPTNLRDNCDILGPQNTRYKDVIISSSCANTYVVRRTWYIFDNCGNTDSTLQEIRIQDNQPPVFSRQAVDLLLQCTETLSVDSLFRAWVARNGDAVASDNCGGAIKWIARNAGTQDTASLPPLSCGSEGQIVLQRRVDFIAEDICGQRSISTALFRVLDLQPPRIVSCARDTVLATASGRCGATFRLPAPQIQEECILGKTAFPQQGGVALYYRIGQGQRVEASDLGVVTVDLPAGSHQITYFVRDCGGNEDSCTFVVQVIDREAPQITCPSDTTIVLPVGDCVVNLALPLPIAASDNCTALNFPLLSATCYATGTSPLPPTALSNLETAPVHRFNTGVTEVFFVIADAAGNKDTCSYKVNVEDRENPLARCQPSTVFINPSGLQNPVVGVQEIDAGSTDNCGIASRTLTPNAFNCLQAGTVQQVILSVTDLSGNMATCSTLVRVENLEPQPAASPGLCGSDTLFLRANPPSAQGGIIYTYRWTGPNGFVSNRENPVVPNVSSRNAGSYSVEITGITGCKATGVVEVPIEDLPLTPELLGPTNYCEEDALAFTSSVAPAGASVTYRWYRGVPPSGVLVGTTIVPALTLPGPYPEGNYTFYLTVESNGCLSRPASPKTILVNKKPVAIPRENTVTVCEGAAIALGTEVSGAGITYEWKGPGGYQSTNQFPVIANAVLSNAGVYVLTVFRNGCPSAPAFVTVTILPRPEIPELSNTGAVCAGEAVTLRTNAAASVYTWVSPDLQEFSTTVNFFTITAAAAQARGDWRVFVATQGCRSAFSLPSTVVVNDIPRPVIAVSPTVVCENGRLQLNATPLISNAIYRWSGPDNFFAVGTAGGIDNMQAKNSGRYAVSVTTQQGCTGSAAVDVSVKPSVRIQSVSNDGVTCLSGPTDIRLTASLFPVDDGSYTYRWTGPNGFLSTSRIGIIPNATQANNGNYQLVVTTSQGCVSSPSGTVVSVSDPPVTPEVPKVSGDSLPVICTGQEVTLCVNGYSGNNVTYHWSTPNDGVVITTTPCLGIPGADIADNGAYTVFVTANGCRSRLSPSLLLKVNPKPEVMAFNNGPVCSGSPLELRATFIQGATYRWSGPNLTSTLLGPVIPQAQMNLHSGTYSVYAELDGCRSELATTQVGVLPVPVSPELEPVSPLCISRPGASLTLRIRPSTTTNGAIYTWKGPNGILTVNLSSELTLSNLSAFSNGPAEFSVEAMFGKCVSGNPQVLAVQLNTIPEDKPFAGADFNACDATPTTLQAIEPRLGTGRWSLVQGPNPTQVVFTSPGKGNTVVTGLKGPALYTFRWTLSNGACTNYAFDEVDVVISRRDTARAGMDTLVCLFPQINLSARPAVNGMGTWSQSAVQSQLGVRILEPNNPRAPVSGMQPGNLYQFTWTVRDGCGTTEDEMRVLISDPSPYAGQDKQICTAAATVQLNADEPTSGSRGRWFGLNTPAAIANPGQRQTMVTNLQAGTNRFVWEIDEGICGADSRDTVLITYRPSPQATADRFEVPFGQPFSLPLLRNDVYSGTVQVRILKAPERGAVQVQADSVVTYKPNINYVGPDRLIYELCSGTCECSTAEVVLEIGKDVGCAVPSVITPNNDGINDALVVPCLLEENAFRNAQLLIINRWGDEVYRSPRPYLNNWSGTYNGEDLPVGTYFYILDLGEGSAPMRGFFVIQR